MIDEQKEMNHMRELVELLNRARRSYEQENTEIMSNYEYDALYDELTQLEKELQDMTDKHCKDIDELTVKKEQELMAV